VSERQMFDSDREAWPYLSQWSRRGAVAFAVYTGLVLVGGAVIGMSATFNARDAHERQEVRRDLQARCCSCTQAELGRCK
jgi:hypothetical protein